MSLAGFDNTKVWSSSVDRTVSVSTGENRSEDPQIIERFKDFLLNFKEENSFIYRQKLLQQINLKKYFLDVDLDHLSAFDEELADELRSHPDHLLNLFEQAAQQVALERTLSREEGAAPPLQIVLRGEAFSTALRDLTNNQIGRLVSVPGIVISASRISSRATEMTVVCKNCKHQKQIKCKAGFSNVMLPRACDRGTTTDSQGMERTCPKDPYVVLGDYCKFVDQQTLKLQENPESVPTGEMPRHVMLSCERYLVDRAVPGTRVTVIGVFTIFQNRVARSKKNDDAAGSIAIRHPYIKVLGLSIDSDAVGRSVSSFGAKEEELFRSFAKRADIYDVISASIAPAIYGHDDVKKAIACLLFGGSRKALPDGMRLRGDINILLLGDPGTAKSQFLKFVEKVAPIGVYTSGKGNSAAGLTASVIREPGTRQFYLEGGAFVLADGGVVCIDEFDKMHSHDRVAIHEAMEQQTISIAKAGITTILNARASVLAAANPVFGSYDDHHSPFENIEFQSTILSRFDMIFLIRDRRSEDRDKKIARHVIDLHQRGAQVVGKETLPGLDPVFLKRYIAFCRARCAPRLSPEAADMLRDHYVALRGTMRKEGQWAVPITVRQLEAIVRITESLAKMSLSSSARPEHVTEAIRLFTVSTVDAASAGKAGAEMLPREVWLEVEAAEKVLLRRIAIGSTMSVQRLRQELGQQGHSALAVGKAVDNLVAKESLEYVAQRKKIRRKR